MGDKLGGILSRIEDIISNIDIEPLRKFFEKLGIDRLFSKEISRRFVLVAFAFIVVLVSALSLVTVLTQRSDGTETTASAQQSTDGIFETDVAAVSSENFRGNFLLLLNDDDSDDVHMIAVVRLDSYENSLRISFLNKTSTCTVNDFSGTLTQHYKTGGIKQLVWAVGEYTGISIERYLVGDEESFESLLQHTGKLQVNVQEKVEHNHHGIGYIIEEGQQTLTPGMFLKYFLYLCSQDKSQSVAELMVLLGINLFSCEDDGVLQSNIDTFTKTFETDISAVDFGTYKGALKKMAAKDNTLLLSIETDFERFRG